MTEPWDIIDKIVLKDSPYNPFKDPESISGFELYMLEQFTGGTPMTTELTTTDTAITERFEDYADAVDVRLVTGAAALVEDKKQLENREFIITQVKQNESDKVRRADSNGVIRPGMFVSLRAVLREAVEFNGELTTSIVFNDGGSGIPGTVKAFIERTQPQNLELWDALQPVILSPAMYCKRGLRASHYTATLADGSQSEATTWYLQ